LKGHDPVRNLMEKGVKEGIFPGGVLLVADRKEILHHKSYGLASLRSGTPMTTDTFFDLASLTKPLATTLAIMKLIDGGRLQLDHPLEFLLPDTAGTDKGSLRIDQLLAHTSGLPDYRPYYLRLGTLPGERQKRNLRRLILKESLIAPGGRKVLYSDLGFMVLEWVIERLSGMRMDAFLTQAVYSPLAIDHLCFIDLEAPREARTYAATEHCPWRNRLLEGCVHDENAYISGGIQGHAGLFGTADAVYGLLSKLLNAYHERIQTERPEADPFRPGLVRRFFEPFEATGRSLGFDRPSPAGSSCGTLFSSNTVGHLGFTGTSFWIDLEHSVVVILLTNRVHPSRSNLGIKGFRPVLHDAVMAQLRKRRKRKPSGNG
jgi:serine-type D-Ala-D-Ala carboxypeptidase